MTTRATWEIGSNGSLPGSWKIGSLPPPREPPRKEIALGCRVAGRNPHGRASTWRSLDCSRSRFRERHPTLGAHPRLAARHFGMHRAAEDVLVRSILLVRHLAPVIP